MQVESSSQPGSGGLCWRMKVGERRELLMHPHSCKLLALQQSLTGLPGFFGPSSHLSSPELEFLSGICHGAAHACPVPPTKPVFTLTQLPAPKPANLIDRGDSSRNSGAPNPQAPPLLPEATLPAPLPSSLLPQLWGTRCEQTQTPYKSRRAPNFLTHLFRPQMRVAMEMC